MPDDPLVSCLMVTLPVPERFEGLKKSVSGYLDQTHGRRELVLVANGGVPSAVVAIKAHIASLGRPDIRIVEPAGSLTLGALRNISKASARGEIICQWDDDDLHHPERLERQVAALVEADAEGVFLQHVMQFFPHEHRLYCANFHNTAEGVFPGSLMCWTASPIVYPERGATARLSEDSVVAAQLISRGRHRALADLPHLYIYVSHGGNSWPDEHHRNISLWHSLSQGLLRRREAALRAGLAAFDLGPEPVTVQGANGPAFVLDPHA
jgi:glycosyltransferase involved in cell wall biosynthesis